MTEEREATSWSVKWGAKSAVCKCDAPKAVSFENWPKELIVWCKACGHTVYLKDCKITDYNTDALDIVGVSEVDFIRVDFEEVEDE